MPRMPDPNAKRRNAEGQFRSIVRDPDRKVPEFPPELEASVPIDAWDIVNAYWREVYVTLADILSPVDRFTVARAAILHVHVAELGAEVPGVMLTNLAKLEDSFGMSPKARLQMRITVVAPEEAPAAGTLVPGTSAPIIDMTSRRRAG